MSTLSRLLSLERKAEKEIESVHLRAYHNRIARNSIMRHLSQVPLSAKEKEEVKHLWGSVGHIGRFDWHRLYKNVNGFDARYVPTDLYGTDIIPLLNRNGYIMAWDDKAYYPRFFPNIRMPVMIACRIDGNFFDSEYKAISSSELISYIRQMERVIVKPSDGLEGRGIEIWNTGEDTDILKKRICSFAQNYVIQEVLSQHSSLAKLNRSSVNPIRVMTLRLNGTIHYLHAIVRFGTPGSITDVRFENGREIIQAAAVSKEGNVASVYYDADGVATRLSRKGIEEGIKIPNFDKVIQLGMEIHDGLQHFDLIGSDITVDETGQPLMIEYNVYWPGIIFPQYCNGPLFADYTEELIYHLRNSKQKK